VQNSEAQLRGSIRSEEKQEACPATDMSGKVLQANILYGVAGVIAREAAEEFRDMLQRGHAACHLLFFSGCQANRDMLPCIYTEAHMFTVPYIA